MKKEGERGGPKSERATKAECVRDGKSLEEYAEKTRDRKKTTIQGWEGDRAGSRKSR